MAPAAFLFDLDGTLIDSEMPWTRAICAFLGDRGVSLAPEDLIASVTGRSWPDIHAFLHANYPALGESSLEEDSRALHAHYDRLMADDPAQVVIPSAVAFFRRVAKLAPCAIVSGSPREDVAAAAAVCGVARLSSLVLGAEDYGRGKPAPDGFLKAASLLDVDASECVVVEDSTVGVLAGRAAGMRVLGVNRNRLVRQDFTGVDWLVEDLSEIDVDAVFGA